VLVTLTVGFIAVYSLYFSLLSSEDPGILVIPDKKKWIQESSNAEDQLDVKYHVVFSTGCTPFQDWQSYVFFYHAWKSGQKGNVTRIASCGNPKDARTVRKLHEETISIMSDRFSLHITIEYSKRVKPGMTYKFFNKPFGMLDFLENVLNYRPMDDLNPNDDTIILLLDPDQMLIRPFTNDFSLSSEVWRPTTSKLKLWTQVTHGHPFAQQYGFGIQWKTKVNATNVANGTTRVTTMDMNEAKSHYALGPPYIATARDMYAIAKKWTEFVPRIHNQYPHLLAEMFAYCFAAAHLNLPHRIAQSFMVSDVYSGGEGWKLVSKMGRKNVCNPPSELNPHVIHYCQRYMLGKWFIGKYRLRKDFVSCESPLLKEPPEDIVKLNYQVAPDGSRINLRNPASVDRNAFMICGLIPRLNQAAIFYKEHQCKGENPNFDKTYIFHTNEEGM
jgi:peptidyl serine alpha-galactosyltransferase